MFVAQDNIFCTLKWPSFKTKNEKRIFILQRKKFGRIDSRSQFHQHINYMQLLRQKSSNLKSKSKKASRETFVRKSPRKMLVKLTPDIHKSFNKSKIFLRSNWDIQNFISSIVERKWQLQRRDDEAYLQSVAIAVLKNPNLTLSSEKYMPLSLSHTITTAS